MKLAEEFNVSTPRKYLENKLSKIKWLQIQPQIPSGRSIFSH